MRLVTDRDALTQYHDVAALWSAGFADPEEVVRAACELLAVGAGGHSLGLLAGLSLRSVDDRDVEDLLDPSFVEVGVAYHVPHSDDAAESALAAMARRVFSGAVRPRDFASWAHRAFGHNRLQQAERLSELDDVYDSIDYTDLTYAEVDAEVVAEARRISAFL